MELLFQWRSQNYRFKFKLGFFCFCLFFISLSYVLGVWQLHRYHYKKNILQSYELNKSATAQPLVTHSAVYQPYQAIMVEGEYRNDLQMLVQNKVRAGRVGYEVLTPMQLQGQKKLVLVNRGWLPASDASALPHVDKVQGKQKIQGHIKFLNEYQFILGKNILEPYRYPLVMQKVDIEELSRITHQDFYPFLLLLDENQANGFERNWTIATVLPQRHMAYAVQWFALGVLLLIVFICVCFEKE
jgi:surfeit locus 1 family protein